MSHNPMDLTVTRIALPLLFTCMYVSGPIIIVGMFHKMKRVFGSVLLNDLVIH
jgi:hypothetical protein